MPSSLGARIASTSDLKLPPFQGFNHQLANLTMCSMAQARLESAKKSFMSKADVSGGLRAVLMFEEYVGRIGSQGASRDGVEAPVLPGIALQDEAARLARETALQEQANASAETRAVPSLWKPVSSMPLAGARGRGFAGVVLTETGKRRRTGSVQPTSSMASEQPGSSMADPLSSDTSRGTGSSSVDAGHRSFFEDEDMSLRVGSDQPVQQRTTIDFEGREWHLCIKVQETANDEPSLQDLSWLQDEFAANLKSRVENMLAEAKRKKKSNRNFVPWLNMVKSTCFYWGVVRKQARAQWQDDEQDRHPKACSSCKKSKNAGHA